MHAFITSWRERIKMPTLKSFPLQPVLPVRRAHRPQPLQPVRELPPRKRRHHRGNTQTGQEESASVVAGSRPTCMYDCYPSLYTRKVVVIWLSCWGHVDACEILTNLQMAGEHLLLPLLRAVPQPTEPVGGLRPRVPRADGALPQAHQEPLQGSIELIFPPGK